MLNPFFITGLPRSRTAWLANLLTTERSFCLHDAMKDGWTAEHIRETIAELSPHYHHVGDSDSGLLLVADRLVELYPDSRWLLIRNTPERAAASYRRYFVKGSEYPGIRSAADIEAIMHAAGTRYGITREQVPASRRLEVDLDELESPATVRRLWDWLVPGLPWDERRYRMLDTFQVNIMPGKITIQL